MLFKIFNHSEIFFKRFEYIVECSYEQAISWVNQLNEVDSDRDWDCEELETCPASVIEARILRYRSQLTHI